MKWFTNFKLWALSWFTDESKLRLLAYLNGIQVFINWAGPIVKEIDEKLKPLLKMDIPAFEAVKTFLEEYQDEFDDVVALAESLKDLPMADLLMNVALECLKLKTNGNVAVSVLRLAVELAYNIYKQTGRSQDNFNYMQ